MTLCLQEKCRHPEHDVTADPEGMERIGRPGPCVAGYGNCPTTENDGLCYCACAHGIDCADGVPLCSECARSFRDVHMNEAGR